MWKMSQKVRVAKFLHLHYLLCYTNNLNESNGYVNLVIIIENMKRKIYDI